jgi:nicotinamidase-related amidase
VSGTPGAVGPPAEKLDRERAALVVVDVQEAFRKAVPTFGEVAEAVGTLVQGAAALGVPVIVTEQYPRGLGVTVAEVAEHLPAGTEPIEKLRFSAAEAEGFDLAGRDQAIICGVETHVCVNQTALDLLGRGVEVQVVSDAVGSRTAENRELGLRRAERAGAGLTSVEMALFELLGGADADEFKTVQGLVM